ncbi:MAG: PAS domain-containing protein [Clostridia bacterium]|nr:PAS domain-containing protein [Clostridia bacterium]
MRKKLLRSLLACSLVTALLICAMASCWLYAFFQRQLADSLKELADAIEQPLSAAEDPIAFLSGGVYSRRVTLMDQQGSVLFDNRRNANDLPDHSGRNEFLDALNTGEGWDVHLSDSMGEISIYYARRLASGMVLRLSDTQSSIFTAFTQALWVLLAGTGLCVAMCAVLARALTRHLVHPLNSIDLDHPMSSAVYEELQPMLARMDEQNQRISEQMRRLEAQHAELDAVLHGMREGLVVLDRQERILAMNPAACAMLNVQDEPIGYTLTQITDNGAVLELADAGEGAIEIHIQHQIVRISASPVAGGGMALLFQDVTSARRAEAGRRQFSANVSHELRTPLTTISGYAEMLASGMANPADAGVLGGKIHQESRRLLTLIEDILHLSRLDEQVDSDMQPVDLTALAQHVAEKLAPLARKVDVPVRVTGEKVIVPGDPLLLEEMIANLVENSLKYNRPGGTVDVETGTRDGRVFLAVRDTGVGIPPEHQERVFERFYRVDKSRSRQIGGTGLGLSIVKHGAQLHRAAVQLESEPGKGTCITLQF